MKKWEYNFVYYLPETSENLINSLGEQGWELICIIPIDNSVHHRWIFKREKIEVTPS